MIYRPATFFTTYKTSFALKRCLKRNPRYIAKFIITLALRFKFALLILLVYEIKLNLFVFVKIALLYRLIYCFIIDNRSIQIIDKVGGVRWRTGKAGGKCRMTSASSDNDFTKMYSTIISRIYISLYGIKLDTKFTNAFGC